MENIIYIHGSDVSVLVVVEHETKEEFPEIVGNLSSTYPRPPR